MRKVLLVTVAVAKVMFTFQAYAHVTLETGEALANSSYKAVLRIPHGCEGKPTTAIKVKIPEGVIAAKPMPKPGWQLTTVKGKYRKTYDYHGTPISEGVVEIAWNKGKLPDEWYDELIFVAYLTTFAPGTVISFPVVQKCAGKVHRWVPGVTIVQPSVQR